MSNIPQGLATSSSSSGGGLRAILLRVLSSHKEHAGYGLSVFSNRVRVCLQLRPFLSYTEAPTWRELPLLWEGGGRQGRT